jgi:hypothetical protein
MKGFRLGLPPMRQRGRFLSVWRAVIDRFDAPSRAAKLPGAPDQWHSEGSNAARVRDPVSSGFRHRDERTPWVDGLTAAQTEARRPCRLEGNI